MGTLQAFSEEEIRSTPCRRAHGHHLAALRPVVGGVEREQGPLEARDRLGDVRKPHRVGLGGERLGEAPGVIGVFPQGLQDLLRPLAEAEFNRLVAEQRDERLGLETRHQGVSPGEHGGVGNVGEAHAVSRMRHARRSEREALTVGEGELLVVTARAGEGPVQREALLVEESTAKLDLGRRHGVVGRDHRRSNAGGQSPGIVGRHPRLVQRRGGRDRGGGRRGACGQGDSGGREGRRTPEPPPA
ncbi:hypothetical protein D3C86_1454590 [compost metagenome]